MAKRTEDSNIILSPDLNPIEHLWDELERRMKKHQLKNIQQLQVLLKDEWNQIESTVFQKLVDSSSSMYQDERLPDTILKSLYHSFFVIEKKILICGSIIFGHENSIHTCFMINKRIKKVVRKLDT